MSSCPARSIRFAKPRNPSPLGGRRPTPEDLEAVVAMGHDHPSVEDILPANPTQKLRILIVGINPGLWTAAVNAPFARPGNRFWPSLHQAGFTSKQVDASTGLAQDDADEMISNGIGLTRLAPRPTARADQLTRDELREGGKRLIQTVKELRPKVAAISGITAFRDAFDAPKAHMGPQNPADFPALEDWPAHTKLWVVPQPSGLNAHYQVADLARIWREVWDDVDAE